MNILVRSSIYKAFSWCYLQPTDISSHFVELSKTVIKSVEKLELYFNELEFSKQLKIYTKTSHSRANISADDE